MPSGRLEALIFIGATAEHMPNLGVFDTALACEVLNYVEDPQRWSPTFIVLSNQEEPC